MESSSRLQFAWNGACHYVEAGVLSIDEHHALVRGNDGSFKLMLTGPTRVPPSIARQINPEQDWRVTLYTQEGLAGAERLRGTVLSVVGETPADVEPLYRVSDTFERVVLTDLWGRSRARLDASRVGCPRVLEVPGVSLHEGTRLHPHTVAMTVRDAGQARGADLPHSDTLRHLSLITARRLASWEDVSATYPGLVEISAYAVPHLTGNRIDRLPSGMLAMRFQACRRLGGLSFVSQAPDLRYLGLEDCKTIDSLAPLAYCPRLEWFVAIGDTDVVDGDLRPLVERASLPRAIVRRRRHYRPHPDELEGVLPQWTSFRPYENRDDLDCYWPDRAAPA